MIIKKVLSTVIAAFISISTFPFNVAAADDDDIENFLDVE